MKETTKPHVLLGERVHELRQDIALHDSLCQLLVVIGETTESQRGRLLNSGHHVQEERPQQSHHPRILKSLDVLGSRSQFGNRLHELCAGLLVLLEHYLTQSQTNQWI